MVHPIQEISQFAYMVALEVIHSLSLRQYLPDTCDGSPGTPVLHADLDFSWCLSSVLTQKVLIGVLEPLLPCTGFYSTRADTTCPEHPRQ